MKTAQGEPGNQSSHLSQPLLLPLANLEGVSMIDWLTGRIAVDISCCVTGHPLGFSVLSCDMSVRTVVFVWVSPWSRLDIFAWPKWTRSLTALCDHASVMSPCAHDWSRNAMDISLSFTLKLCYLMYRFFFFQHCLKLTQKQLLKHTSCEVISDYQSVFKSAL